MNPPDPFYDRIGECQHHALGEPMRAIELAQALLAEKNLTPYARMFSLDCMARGKVIAGDPGGAVKIENEVLALLEKNAMPDAVQANIYSNAGGIFHGAGDIHRATELYQKAFGYAKSSRNPDAQVAVLIDMGNLYAEAWADPIAADGYYKQAIDLSRSNGHEDAAIYFMYGSNLEQMHRFDEAYSSLQHAIEMTTGKPNYAGIRYRSLAESAKVLMTRRDFEEARKRLEEALAGQRSLPDALGEGGSLMIYGHLQLTMHDAQGALKSGERALQLGKQSNSQPMQMDAMHMMSDSYAMLGQMDQANAMGEKAHVLEIAMRRAQDLNAVAGLESKIKDQAIAAQNEKLQTQTDTLQRATWKRNVLIGVLILLIGVGGFTLFYQYRMSRRFHILSTVDPLSGLLNRREAARILGSYPHSMDEVTGKRTGLFLIDADHFKAINDRYGHDAGDRVLVEIANRIRGACRPEDLVARWGGEEFLVGAWQVTQNEAIHLAERLRSSLESESIHLLDGTALTITVSIGFALFPFFPALKTESWRRGVFLADRALYAAKRSGRNMWAGMWGTAGATGASMQDVHEDPEQAIQDGWIETAESKPLIWSKA